jgi:hypothetical protein
MRGLVACAVTLSLGVGPVLAQSIGEVVEKDKKRREALKGKAKSYGDADLTAGRPTPEPEASPSPAAGTLVWPTPKAVATTAPVPTPTSAPRTPAEKAKASMSAPGGAEYRSRAGQRLSDFLHLELDRCIKTWRHGHATLWFHIDSRGTLVEVLYDPPSPGVSCLADGLRGKEFPPPPVGEFWLTQELQWSAP